MRREPVKRLALFLPDSELVGVEEAGEIFGTAHFSQLQAVHLALYARNYSHIVVVQLRLVHHAPWVTAFLRVIFWMSA